MIIGDLSKDYGKQKSGLNKKFGIRKRSGLGGGWISVGLMILELWGVGIVDVLRLAGIIMFGGLRT
ncbi:MAG: hypothetical protein MI922_00855 [Bacteroidales bacterium]|nr:hypothetical protein [Bacteroidales bacterium]